MKNLACLECFYAEGIWDIYEPVGDQRDELLAAAVRLWKNPPAAALKAASLG